MVAQVSHEAEVSRQHARYKIPAKLIIDFKGYSLIDWSVSGLRVKLPEEISELKIRKAQLEFTFENVSTSTFIEIEEVARDKEEGITGYRYINLERSQIAVLHHVINAYLSGEIIDTGSIIEIVKRDAFTSNEKSKKLTEKLDRKSMFFFQFKRIVGTLALLATLLSLLGFVGYSIYNRIFTLNSVTASVNAPVVIVRSPQGSYFEKIAEIQEYSRLKKGDLLATLRFVNGGVANILSPCDCIVISSHLSYKQFVNQGEPLFTLLPEKEVEVFIEAKFDFGDVKRLAIGQVATIQFVNGKQKKGVISNILSSETLVLKHASPLKNIRSTPVNYAKVIIMPKTKINLDLLGTVATVSIDSFNH